VPNMVSIYKPIGVRPIEDHRFEKVNRAVTARGGWLTRIPGDPKKCGMPSDPHSFHRFYSLWQPRRDVRLTAIVALAN
jgi:hypothetical protein